MHADLYEHAQSVSPNTHTHTLLWPVVTMTWMKLLIQSKHSHTMCVCVCVCVWPPALTQGQVEEVLWSVKGVTLLVFLSLPNLHFLFFKYSPAARQLSDSPSLSLFLSLCSSHYDSRVLSRYFFRCLDFYSVSEQPRSSNKKAPQTSKAAQSFKLFH